jgi:hypothetical protein
VVVAAIEVPEARVTLVGSSALLNCSTVTEPSGSVTVVSVPDFVVLYSHLRLRDKASV